MQNISNALQFESFVLNILRTESRKEGKTILAGPETGPDYGFDAIAPDGFSNLPGPCVIEIKYSASWDILRRVVDRSFRTNYNFASLLLITNQSSYRLKKLKANLHNRFPNFEIEIYGKEEIDQLSSKNPEAAFTYDRKYLNQAVEIFEERDPRDITKQNLESLKSAYLEDQLVLFLGAGVSLASGLPAWGSLLNSLSISLVEKNPAFKKIISSKESLVEYFKSEIPASPLITARILRDSLGNNFPEHVRKSLYLNFNPSKSSELVEEIGALCVPGRMRQGLVSVVTYNYDEIIEIELQKRSVNYYVVVSEGDTPSKNELPVFHPHGFLPLKGKLNTKYRESLVLSEEAYHSQFIDPYAWPNITQLNLLRNNVCLFVGLSMTDPNLRRLLEISHQKRPGVRHYAILKDHWKPNKKLKNLGDMDKISNVFRGLEESTFNKLGVSVIWVNEHSDTPSIIREIRK